jgi:hypothetical protein
LKGSDALALVAQDRPLRVDETQDPTGSIEEAGTGDASDDAIARTDNSVGCESELYGLSSACRG